MAIDDLDAERRTEYVDEIVFKVIDNRVSVKRPMIITTNLTWEQLKNPSDVMRQRIFSRIMEACHPVHVTGADLRKKSLVDSFVATNRLLGLSDEGG